MWRRSPAIGQLNSLKDFVEHSMPQFGVCTGPENAAMLRDAGWEYIEPHYQQLLQVEKSSSDWIPPTVPLVLPMPVANCLLPNSLKVSGPDASLANLAAYLAATLPRAASLGIQTLVLGSGNARKAPDGFDRVRARQQIIEFARMAVRLARAQGITIVLEPLNSKDCNLINTIADAMACVREVDHLNFLCLLDTWHFWLEHDSLNALRESLPWIYHVHLADLAGRLAPGQTALPQQASDYLPFFKLLKNAGYNRRISVEAAFTPDMASTARSVLSFLKQQWDAA
jgi:sugar phosphate isomerase/epimerase